MAGDRLMPLIRDYISDAALLRLVEAARAEDMGSPPRDITSELLIPAEAVGDAEFRARVAGTLAGAALLPAIAACYDHRINVSAAMADGITLAPGDVIACITGPLRSLLAMERIALNFMMHLSGIATLTARYVAATAGAKARVCDTRKTIPGLRALEKYAVACGGGVNHRMGLHDAVLVKDNHIAHLSLDELPLFLAGLIERARGAAPAPTFIEVEVDRLAQLERVLGLPHPPDMVLLDNMPAEFMRQAVTLRDRLSPGVLLEASGGVTLDSIPGIAATGVDRISIGALTHSAPALDIGLDIA